MSNHPQHDSSECRKAFEKEYAAKHANLCVGTQGAWRESHHCREHWQTWQAAIELMGGAGNYSAQEAEVKVPEATPPASANTGEDKLLPCPFCGGSAEFKSNAWFTWVECERHCNEYTGMNKRGGSPDDRRKDAASIWNTRPAPADTPLVECKHEPFEGVCVHCNAPYVGGRPIVRKHTAAQPVSLERCCKAFGDSVNKRLLGTGVHGFEPHPDDVKAILDALKAQGVRIEYE